MPSEGSYGGTLSEGNLWFFPQKGRGRDCGKKDEGD